MIESFFQSLNRHQVEYLLISGQASVLYGAATFSEDIDLWINPTPGNLNAFTEVLTGCEACYHKLTPPFTVENLQKGHGFHYRLTDPHGDPIYLDVMGNPPRAGSFSEVSTTARQMETEWGNLRTIGIQPLVELKKTQRLEDYAVISKLALAWFDQPECRHATTDLVWALQNVFTLPELAVFFFRHATAVDLAFIHGFREAGEFGRQLHMDGETAEPIERKVTIQLQARIADCQLADRRYWREIIRQLKEMRALGQLMPEGMKVSPPT
jgi:hypothetical protein